MNMNHYIDKNHYRLKSYILWQQDHYHYQITTAQTREGFKVMLDMPDTKYEQALEQFKQFRPN